MCLSRHPSDFTNQPSQRFTVDEDCLYLNIFAPSNATNLPVMYFIQGGGFQSNSNMNFNGSRLAVFGNIVVVQINYRVGPFGFLQSREVQAGGTLNAGLKDMIQGLKWVQRHISSVSGHHRRLSKSLRKPPNMAQFGGDPTKVTVAGDSAGATAIALLMAAFASSDPGLFRGAIMESPSVATIRTMEQGQQQYACLLNATGCANQQDTLTCLRRVSAKALQTEQCQFNPHIDDDLIKEPMLTAFAAGRYLRIPSIAGTCTDEGTKNVPQNSINTTADALRFVNNQASGVLSDNSLQMVRQRYGLDPTSPEATAQSFPNSSPLWRPLSNAHGDFRAHCITARIQDGLSANGNTKTWNYRYGVLDPEQEALGFGAYHVVEMNGVFGPENTDGFPPKSYLRGGENADIVPVTMAYWASFVRTLDPNTDAAAIMQASGIPLASASGSAAVPEWRPWTADSRERLLFQTNNTRMESMPDRQIANCFMFDPMLPAIESIMPQGTVVELRTPDASGGRGENGGGGSPFDQGFGFRNAAAGGAGRGAAGVVMWSGLVVGVVAALMSLG